MMNAPNSTTSKPRENRGRALLLEHLPDIKFRQSIQGVLFIIFSNGEAFFYPLNDQSKGNHPGSTTPARLLTFEPSERSKKIQAKQPVSSPITSTPTSASTTTPSSSSKSGTSEVISDVNRYFVYDTLVPFKDDMFRVFSFCFEDQSSPPSTNEDDPPNLESTGPIQSLLPRKISLSPNKRLLLILGAIYRGQSCLLVYQILEEGTGSDFFKLIFFDFSFSFVDVCFSSDSKGLLAIPTKFPSYIFMLSLPLPSTQSQTSNPPNPTNKTTPKKPPSFSSNSQIDSSLKTRTVNFEARRAGPLTIIGPGKGLLGQPLKMSHIASNSCQIINNSEIDYYHFVTWNDEPLGEFCLWRLCKEGNFECSPRCAVPKYDKTILEKTEAPKNFIIEIQFSSREGKIMLVIRKENYPKKSENGIGLQTVKLEPSPDTLDNRNWYQVVDTPEPIFCIKWTNTLLLGTVQAAAIFIKGKGLFELVDSCYASEFQAFYDTFKEEAHNFVQVGRYHRFWVSGNGALRVMVVTPQLPSNHPEWCELFKQNQTQVLINMRILGRRIGVIQVEGTNVTRKVQKKPTENGTAKLQTGILHRYCGYHLYRCWLCKRPLLKPLACSRCLSVVYCSKVCQQNDWTTHRVVCQPKT